jgi:hypothetical protein
MHQLRASGLVGVFNATVSVPPVGAVTNLTGEGVPATERGRAGRQAGRRLPARSRDRTRRRAPSDSLATESPKRVASAPGGPAPRRVASLTGWTARTRSRAALAGAGAATVNAELGKLSSLVQRTRCNARCGRRSGLRLAASRRPVRQTRQQRLAIEGRHPW